jgi:aspartate racemase
MKTIGLIGGLSWESTAVYYRWINEEVRRRLGGLHSAKLILCSVDLHEIAQRQHVGDWHGAGAILVEAARRLEGAGADCVALCTNTMHKVADEIQTAVQIPMLHIVDITATEIRRQGLSTVGLLGTRFTMEQDFYRERFRERHGLQVLVPNPDDRDVVHRVIYDELCKGIVRPESRAEFLRILHRLAADGAQAVVLGCTEISMLIDQRLTEIRLFDTTAIHAVAAVDFALGD